MVVREREAKLNAAHDFVYRIGARTQVIGHVVDASRRVDPS